MMRSIILGVCLVALGACQSAQNLSQGERLNWSCANDNSFSLRTVGESVEVYAGGETNRLAPAADNTFSNGTITLTQSGGRATLTGANGGPYENCSRQRGDWWPDLW
jgi:hypothetical protein